ncbi:restriction endonuclease subunit S [Bacillus cereus]|uniref:restriction endonuclease subunit S n=3 Tax=Bacillus cereus TaxID=1396 RepID=UPI001EE737E1|nr:restriction endonuclease subunit S [Bacillus cereus]
MKKNNMPWVRFAGFIEEWGQCKLGEISEKVTEKNKDNIYSETLTNSAELGIINQRDFFDKDISNKKNLDGYYVVHPDDFVYNPRISNLAPVGPIKRNKLGRTGVMSPLYYVFRTHDVDKTYLEKYFSSNSWHLFMKLNGDSGARADRFAIKDSIFREMPIPIPLIEEQTKIGNFFKQLDNTIALHQQELDIIKQTKQGFLQKMFPNEGESVPEVRFPGYTGDWKERKLINNIIEKVLDFRGKSPAKFGMRWGNSGYLVLSALNVKNGYIDKQVEAKYGDQTLFERWMGKERLEKGDVVFTTEAPLGNVAQVPDDNGYILNQRAVAFKTSTEKTDNNFLAQLLRSPLFQTKLKANASGGTAKGIGMKEFAKMSATIPVSVEEQIKIGNFFKQLDDTISLQQRELDALKETKKAFLQKMFV